jgi:hypothetical protein
MENIIYPSVIKDNYTIEDFQRIQKEQMALLSDEERAKREAEIAFANKGVVKSINEKLVIIRAKRDMLLAKTDYMFLMPDAVVNDKIIKYRQELRDFPNKIVDGIYDKHIHILAIPDDEIISYLPKLEKV